jgi:hypothetical protein
MLRMQNWWDREVNSSKFGSTCGPLHNNTSAGVCAAASAGSVRTFPFTAALCRPHGEHLPGAGPLQRQGKHVTLQGLWTLRHCCPARVPELRYRCWLCLRSFGTVAGGGGAKRPKVRVECGERAARHHQHSGPGPLERAPAPLRGAQVGLHTCITHCSPSPPALCTLACCSCYPRHCHARESALITCLPDTAMREAEARLPPPCAGSRTRRSRMRRHSSCRWCGP